MNISDRPCLAVAVATLLAAVVVPGARADLDRATPGTVARQERQPERRSVAVQEQQPQIRASVEVVRLSVAVVHTGGGMIPPLGVEDFEVYDNGVRQRVRLLHRPEETPLRVALVLDASPSLRPWWFMVQRAAVSFLAKLGRQGCPYVLPFSDGIGPGRWGRYTANDWRAFLARAVGGDGTSLYDALIIALDQLAMADDMAISASQPLREPEPDEEPAVVAERSETARPGEMTRSELVSAMQTIIAEIIANNPFTHIGNCDLRYVPPQAESEDAVLLPEDESIKAVLLLSDGDDTTSVATMQDVINAARLANVPVFPVLVGTASRDAELVALLGEIARATGGLVTHDVSMNELGGAYDRVLGYLRASYVLVYDPDEAPETAPGAAARQPESSWHEVRVELRRPLLRAIARPGYYR